MPVGGGSTIAACPAVDVQDSCVGWMRSGGGGSFVEVCLADFVRLQLYGKIEVSLSFKNFNQVFKSRPYIPSSY